MQAGKFLPIRRRDLVRRLVEQGLPQAAGGGDDPVRDGPGNGRESQYAHTLRLLGHVLRYEAEARARPLRDAYEALDPDPLVPPPRGGQDIAAFLEAFGEAVDEANFERLTEEALRAAFAERSLFPLLAEVDLREYDVLRMHYRGVGHRTERVRGWSTWWRWRTLDVDYYERLIVVLRLKDDALQDKSHFAMVGMEPGKVYLKSFKNVPRADVEMVLPNTRLRVRPVDRALIGVPLAGGVLWTLYQSIGILALVAGGSFALSLDDPRLRALGGFLLVLGGYLWRSHAKLKATKLEYLKTLSEGLYFRNLANNAAVIDQVLAMGDEEEAKEAFLAYHILAGEGPLRVEDLDRRAEAWVEHETGRSADFDVHDGLACLQGLGLAEKSDDDTWHVLPPRQAAAHLDARWDGAFSAEAPSQEDPLPRGGQAPSSRPV